MRKRKRNEDRILAGCICAYAAREVDPVANGSSNRSQERFHRLTKGIDRVLDASVWIAESVGEDAVKEDDIGPVEE